MRTARCGAGGGEGASADHHSAAGRRRRLPGQDCGRRCIRARLARSRCLRPRCGCGQLERGGVVAGSRKVASPSARAPACGRGQRLCLVRAPRHAVRARSGTELTSALRRSALRHRAATFPQISRTVPQSHSSAMLPAMDGRKGDLEMQITSDPSSGAAATVAALPPPARRPVNMKPSMLTAEFIATFMFVLLHIGLYVAVISPQYQSVVRAGPAARRVSSVGWCAPQDLRARARCRGPAARRVPAHGSDFSMLTRRRGAHPRCRVAAQAAGIRFAGPGTLAGPPSSTSTTESGGGGGGGGGARRLLAGPGQV